jgi:hypothetical protein
MMGHEVISWNASSGPAAQSRRLRMSLSYPACRNGVYPIDRFGYGRNRPATYTHSLTLRGTQVRLRMPP